MLERKPVNRSYLRRFLGKKYYTYKRYFQWITTEEVFGKIRNGGSEVYTVAQHRTPLLRKLKNVDMRLQYNKITNLNLAINRINGFTLYPGECFSYWKAIGRPTKRKGYLPGLVLNPDGTFGEGTAGGLCQLSNMIYWITLHTELRVQERYRHSHDIFPDTNRTQPFGSGATCVYNYLDLKIKNDSDKVYKLKLEIIDEKLWGSWLCNEKSLYDYEIYQRDHSFTKGWWGGYIRNNSIYRKVYNRIGEEVDDEFITENHAIMMYNPLLQECK